MTFSLRQLKYLVAVADSGSITAASKELGISQPAISAAIRDLEIDFGLTLFARQRARRVTLTPSGRRAVSEARILLADAERLGDNVRGLGTVVSGTLRVGCFRPTAPFIMPIAFRGMRQAHPDVTVRIQEADLADVANLLLEGTVDAALTYDMHLDSDLEFDPLITVRPYALLAHDDPIAQQPEVRLKQLLEREMVTLDLPFTQDFFLSLFYAHGLRPNIGLRTKSYEMARSMVGTGRFFTILIMKPVVDRTYDGTRLVCRPIKDNIPMPRYGIALPKAGMQTRLTTAFCDVCRQFLKTEDLAGKFFVR